MQHLSDNSLMMSVKSGDLDKLGILFKRYSRVLFRFVYSMTGDAQESEDLVQSVFYRMLKYRHTYTGEGEFTTWMYHLTRNLLNDNHKKNSRFQYKKDVSDYEDILHYDGGADKALEKEQELTMLGKALDALEVDEKEVLMLSKFQELKYEQIGRIMNCSEGAVKVRVHRALNQLKKVYLKLNVLP